MVVFAALAALTILTVAASFLHVSTSGHIAIALFIAAIKASMVGAYFMHLISERKALYSILILCVVLLLALLVIIPMTNGEVVARELVTVVP